MKKFRLEINVSLSDEAAYTSTAPMLYDSLKLEGLTFFQVCVILGGLQVLAKEAKNE